MSDSNFSRFIEKVWPQERDFLVRPDRWKYVRKLVKTTGCVFCEAEKLKPSFESLCVFQSKLAMIILNKYPYNSGHLMVLPRRHCGSLLDLSPEEYQQTTDLIRVCVEVLTKEYQPAGFNIGLNNGVVAGAGIPDHLHWHVIPRWTGDTNFFPLIAETKVLSESLEKAYERISPHFSTGSK